MFKKKDEPLEAAFATHKKKKKLWYIITWKMQWGGGVGVVDCFFSLSLCVSIVSCFRRNVAVKHY